jgi:hypothetical protein
MRNDFVISEEIYKESINEIKFIGMGKSQKIESKASSISMVSFNYDVIILNIVFIFKIKITN